MMRKYLPYFLAIYFMMLLFEGARAQLSVNPTSTTCGCTGSINFQTTLTGNVTYTVTNASGGVVNTQTNATGTYVLTGLCNQVYVLRATNGTGNVLRAFNVPSPQVNPGVASTDTICSNEGQTELENLVFNLQPGGSWFGPNNLAHSPQFNASIDGTGLYYYQYTTGGCTVSTGVYITRLQNANSGTSTNYLFCEDDPPFNLIDYLEGSPDPGGTFLNLSGQQVSPVYDPATMPSMNLVYVLNTVAGCPPIYTDYILSNTSLPNPGTDNTVLACSDGNVFNMTSQLLGSPQLNGQWYNPSGVPVSNQFNPANMTGGTYRYQVPGANTCPSRSSFLTINTTPDNPSGLSNNVLLCPSSAPVDMFNELGGNPLTGGTWRNPSNQVTDAIFNPANELGGNYTYYYPNVNCTPPIATITVTIQANPSAGNDANIQICQSLAPYNLNNALSANATLGGTWRNASGTTVSNLANIPTPGTYQFTYNVGGGDCASDQAVITISVVGMNPNILGTSVSLCSTDAAFDMSTLYPAYPTVFFRNASGAVVPDIINPATATSVVYTAVYPTTTVCPSTTAPVTVTIFNPAFTSRTIDHSICESSNTLDLTSLAPGINYNNGAWTTAAGAPANPVIAPLSPGTLSYLFTSVPAGTCASSVLTVNLTVDQSVSAGGDGAVAYCASAPFQSFATLMPSTVSQGGAWFFGSVLYAESGIDPASSPSGIYRYVIPPNGSCPGDECALTVQIDALVQANAGPDVEQCADNSIVSIGTTPVGTATYTWSPATGLSSTEVAQPTISMANTSQAPIVRAYTLTVENGLCTTSDEVTVIVNPIPTAQVTPSAEVCAGENVLLVATGGDVYTWQPSALFASTTSNSVNFSPTSDLVVSVEVSNAWNCSSSASSTVTVHPIPTASLSLENVEGCAPVETDLVVDAGGTYTELTWYLNGEQIGSSDSLQVELEEEGEYFVLLVYSNEFGCIDSTESEASISVYANPVADFNLSPDYLSPINDAVQVQNQSLGATTFTWDFAGLGSSSAVNPSFTFPSDVARRFDICLNVLTEHGCSDSICSSIEMIREVAFYAPNAITADNDGLNDVFLPVMLGFELTSFNMKIFNRWGDMIFESNDATVPWIADVNAGSHYANEDVYQWVVTIKENGVADYRTFRGFVTVLR